jgi:hypothetical protein
MLLDNFVCKLNIKIKCLYSWIITFIYLGRTPDDQMGVGIFYHNQRTRRLTGTFSSTLDLDIKKEKSNCMKCH